MEAYSNPTKSNMKKKMGSPPPALNRVNKTNLSSRQPRRLKFDMEAYLNKNKRNIKKKIRGHLPPHPNPALNRVNKKKYKF